MKRASWKSDLEHCDETDETARYRITVLSIWSNVSCVSVSVWLCTFRTPVLWNFRNGDLATVYKRHDRRRADEWTMGYVEKT